MLEQQIRQSLYGACKTHNQSQMKTTVRRKKERLNYAQIKFGDARARLCRIKQIKMNGSQLNQALVN